MRSRAARGSRAGWGSVGAWRVSLGALPIRRASFKASPMRGEGKTTKNRRWGAAPPNPPALADLLHDLLAQAVGQLAAAAHDVADLVLGERAAEALLHGADVAGAVEGDGQARAADLLLQRGGVEEDLAAQLERRDHDGDLLHGHGRVLHGGHAFDLHLAVGHGGGHERGDAAQAARVEQVAVVVHGVHVEVAHPDLLAGLDAQLGEVDGLAFADAAVDDAGQLDGRLRGRPDLEVGAGEGHELRARGHGAVVGRVGVGRAHGHLDADDDLRVAQVDARAALRLLDPARLDLHGAELVEGAAVLALAVAGELREVVALDLVDDVVRHQATSGSSLSWS